MIPDVSVVVRNALVQRSSIVVLAAHSGALVRSTCNRALLVDAGRVVSVGAEDAVVETDRELITSGRFR